MQKFEATGENLNNSNTGMITLQLLKEQVRKMKTLKTRIRAVIDKALGKNRVAGAGAEAEAETDANDVFTNKTTSPLAGVPLCAARNRPIW